MVAADVSHRVVGTVGMQRSQLVLQHLVHALVTAQRLAGGEIDIEIELRIQHAGLDITAYQLRAAVRLTDHPYLSARPAGGDLLA